MSGMEKMKKGSRLADGVKRHKISVGASRKMVPFRSTWSFVRDEAKSH